jgi:uncharacterized protein YhfF
MKALLLWDREPPIEKIAEFWQGFVKSDPETARLTTQPYEVWSFGNTKEMADGLGHLVLEGTKTATCSLLWEYEIDDEKIPSAGDRSIISDAGGNPLCVIETVAVEIKPYCEVDADFAYAEGEGDRSLGYWRKAHWQFFSKICSQIGREVNKKMPLVCERFQVIYKPGMGD